MQKNKDRNRVTFDSEAFARWVQGTPQNMPVEFCGITQDTRKLVPGMLYVALKGANFDGHDFVGGAFSAGAAAALVEERYTLPDELTGSPLIRVKDTRAALLDAAREWRRACGARVIGITGSSGKTTTKEMAAALLAAGGKVCSTEGNLNNDIGLPLSVLSMAADCDFGVFELGTNHPGEIALLAEVLRPDFGIVTSVGTAHIENFGSVEAIAREKGSLGRSVCPGGGMILCLETETYEILRELSAAPVFTVSLKSRLADFHGEIIDAAHGRIRISERGNGSVTELECGLPGAHNAVDLLLAFAAARLAGIPAEATAAALEKLTMPAMRWERVERGDGVTIINDAYNANPESVRAVLKVFGTLPCGGSRVAALGDMKELGEFTPEYHRAVGVAAAESGLDLLCLIGEYSSRYTAAGATESGFPPEKVLCFKDAVAAGQALQGRLHAGDLLLIKASRAMSLERMLDEM